MGQTLSAPITDKHSSAGHDKRFAYGASAMQGWRISITNRVKPFSPFLEACFFMSFLSCFTVNAPCSCLTFLNLFLEIELVVLRVVFAYSFACLSNLTNLPSSSATELYYP